jgi:nicotinamidase-related amidase
MATRRGPRYTDTARTACAPGLADEFPRGRASGGGNPSTFGEMKACHVAAHARAGSDIMAGIPARPFAPACCGTALNAVGACGGHRRWSSLLAIVALEVYRMVDFDADAKRTALINVDMQNLFVEGYEISAPDGLIIQERINRISAACRKVGIPVIHTRHVYRADGSNVGIYGQFYPAIKSLLAEGSEAAQLHPKLRVKPDDIILNKPRFGAFHGTNLELILRSRGIDTVIITGIATNVCCETTAREPSVRDFRVFFLNDATATSRFGDLTAAEVQRATCATLGLVFAEVLTTDEMLNKIDRAGSTTR